MFMLALYLAACHTPEAVTTVFKCSWRWKQKASETCRVLLQLLINILAKLHHVGFLYILSYDARKLKHKIQQKIFTRLNDCCPITVWYRSFTCSVWQLEIGPIVSNTSLDLKLYWKLGYFSVLPSTALRWSERPANIRPVCPLPKV